MPLSPSGYQSKQIINKDTEGVGDEAESLEQVLDDDDSEEDERVLPESEVRAILLRFYRYKPYHGPPLGGFRAS